MENKIVVVVLEQQLLFHKETEKENKGHPEK